MTFCTTTPVFERAEGEPAPIVPPDADFFDSLDQLDWNAMKEVGMMPWNDTGNPDPEDVELFGEGVTLWLLPGEWYRHIPDGLPLVTISGKRMRFRLGESDDDIRFGMLPYGVLSTERKPRL